MKRHLTREEVVKIVSLSVLELAQSLANSLDKAGEDVTVSKLTYLIGCSCKDPDISAKAIRSVTDNLGLTEIVILELEEEDRG
jgi:hypothetical protein